jgi:hypothetical protein
MKLSSVRVEPPPGCPSGYGQPGDLLRSTPPDDVRFFDSSNTFCDRPSIAIETEVLRFPV